MRSGILQTPPKSTIGWVTAIAFLCLFLLGLVDNLKGATLPAVLADLNFSDAQGGAILLWAYLGFLVAALLVGVLSDLAGNRAVVLASTVCLLLGTLGYSLASRLGLLQVSMGVLGIGLGGVDMAGYLIVVAYYTQNKGRYLNLTAFFHGLASTIAPYYAGLLLAVGISWRQVYQYPLAIVLVTLLLGLLVRFPKPPVVQKSSIDFRAVGRLIFQPVMRWYFALMILYVAAEIGVASWIVIYLQRVHNLDVTASALILSLYFAGLMMGRLIGTVFVDKVGFLRSILIMTLCATACLALGMFGSGLSYWLLPLTGLFFSIIFPTLTAAVTDQVTGNVGTVVGLLFAFCGVGGALGPWLIGLISDLAGIQAGFAVNLASSAAMAVIALVLVRHKQAVRPVKSMAQ
jgi:MFS transporter, FHS family, glucose/mannose:H+ symporter